MCSMLPFSVMIIRINHQHYHGRNHHHHIIGDKYSFIYLNRITISPNNDCQEMSVGGWGQSQRYGAPLMSLIHPQLQRFIHHYHYHSIIWSLIHPIEKHLRNNFVFFCRIMSLPSSLFLSLSSLLALSKSLPSLVFVKLLMFLLQ